METDLKKAIIRGGDLLDEGKFDFDRTAFFNSSEAGQCIRRLWYSKHMPEKAAKQDWGYARRGQMIEDRVVEMLRAANVPLIWAGADQKTFQKGRFSATPDGVIDYDTSWEGIEIKSIDPRANKVSLPKAEHVLQLQIAMELVAQEKPKGVAFSFGHLLYVDASNLHDILQFRIERDETVLDRMGKKASKVFRTRNVDMLDREGKTKGGKECSLCAYRDLCIVSVDVASRRKRANRGSNMHVHLRSYIDAEVDEADAKARKSAAAEELKQGLADRGVSSVVLDSHTITLSDVKGRESFDRKAAEAAGLNLDPFVKVGKPSERLTVKRVV